MSRRQSSDAPNPQNTQPGDGEALQHARLRLLPSVSQVLTLLTREFATQVASTSDAQRTDAVPRALEVARQRILTRQATPPSDTLDTIAAQASALLAAAQRQLLRPVINATGVIVNTNLGRAPLSADALGAAVAVAGGYSNLEYDLEAGARGSRQTPVRALLCALTGAEDALVVNNNAAAVLVVLSALAHGRQVIISRGELVEIGGGFRIPDVMVQSGAQLVEVGTTNRTRLRDYEQALTDTTALILSVHPSNFRVVGFTESAPLADLAALAHSRDLLLVHDAGSGALLATERWGLGHEPRPQESIIAGADVVCFSGDKLLGGPQAGIIVGRRAVLQRIERHPLMRAVRIDKMTLAALEVTLRHYRDGDAEQTVPVWHAITATTDELRERVECWVQQLRSWGCEAAAVPGHSTVGGGSLPGETLPTVLCALSHVPEQQLDGQDAHDVPGQLALRLRAGDPPVIARVLREQLLLDPRTVLPAQDDILLHALHAAITLR